VRRRNRAALERAMDAITKLSTGDVLAEVHDSLVMQLPYEDAVPDQDRAGFGQFLDMAFAMFQRFDITLTHIFDLVDPEVLVATYTGSALVRNKDVNYANEYIGVFKFHDGKITLWREYANPETSHAAIAACAD
jgi:ketosteroid isomerase-like protein